MDPLRRSARSECCSSCGEQIEVAGCHLRIHADVRRRRAKWPNIPMFGLHANLALALGRFGLHSNLALARSRDVPERLAGRGFDVEAEHRNVRPLRDALELGRLRGHLEPSLRSSRSIYYNVAHAAAEASLLGELE